MIAREEYIDKPVELLLQSAYSTNKGPRWRRKQLGLVGSDVKDERFRQCLLSDYLSFKAYLQFTTTQTDGPNRITREVMMVSGPVKLNATIRTPLLTFATSLGTCQSTCRAAFSVGLAVL